MRQQKMKEEQVKREDEEKRRKAEWDIARKESKQKQREFRERQEVCPFKIS